MGTTSSITRTYSPRDYEGYVEARVQTYIRYLQQDWVWNIVKPYLHSQRLTSTVEKNDFLFYKETTPELRYGLSIIKDGRSCILFWLEVDHQPEDGQSHTIKSDHSDFHDLFIFLKQISKPHICDRSHSPDSDNQDKPWL